ncbi:MAG: hypothetical protein KDG52_18600 [Rhodocyclaceae bacterium]|nr:hypothetical protein [Rhodocyclaceae bacterium]
MNRQHLKKRVRDLWAAAGKLRANSDLKASEYGTPVLGLLQEPDDLHLGKSILHVRTPCRIRTLLNSS